MMDAWYNRGRAKAMRGVALAILVMAPLCAEGGWVNIYFSHNLEPYGHTCESLGMGVRYDDNPWYELVGTDCLFHRDFFWFDLKTQIRATSTAEGGRFVCTGFTGDGDYAGKTSSDGGDGFWYSEANVFVDNNINVAWSYTIRHAYTQYVRAVDGSWTSPPVTSGWVAHLANLNLHRPDIFTNGRTYRCTGWTNGFNVFGSTGSTNRWSGDLTNNSSLTWVYEVVYPLNLQVLPSGAQAACDARPHRGDYPAVQPYPTHTLTASVLEVLSSGSDRYVCTGYVGGVGGVSPAASAGTVAGGRVTKPFLFETNSGLTFMYRFDRKLTVNIAGLDAVGKTAASPVPVTGEHWFVSGSTQALSVVEVVTNGDTFRNACIGWQGSGSVPATGGASSVSVVMSNLSAITWLYQRAQYYTVSFTGLPVSLQSHPGIVPPVGTRWVRYTNNVVFSVPAVITNPANDTRYIFVGWTNGAGNIAATGATNAMTVLATADSAIRWIYRPEHKLTIDVNPPDDPGTNSWPADADAQPPVGSYWYQAGTVMTVSVLKLVGTNACLGPIKQGAVTNGAEDSSGARWIMTFTMNEPGDIEWKFSPKDKWDVGSAVVPPDGVDSNVMPAITINDPPGLLWNQGFFWGGAAGNKRLYPIRPMEDVLITWTNLGSGTTPQAGKSVWPTEVQTHIAGVPADVSSLANGYQFVSVQAYKTSDGAVINGTFNANSIGKCMLHFVQGEAAQATEYPSRFIVVESVLWGSLLTDRGDWPAGAALTDALHNEPMRTGYLLTTNGMYDVSAYSRASRTGSILPVNTDTNMTVVWYRRGDSDLNLYWPVSPCSYDIKWPDQIAGGSVTSLVISSQAGSGPLWPAAFPDAQVYVQSDAALPGCNPNEEHAALFNVGGAPTLFALRNDLNDESGRSEPYVLLKYRDPVSSTWAMKVYKVVAETNAFAFSYTATAGSAINPPYPLSAYAAISASSNAWGGVWYHRDHKGGHWAKAAGSGTNVARVAMHWYYPLQSGFYYPDPSVSVGDPVPFLSGGPHAAPPTDVVYTVTWPIDVPPVLYLGETLMEPMRGLPDIFNMGAAEVIFDESVVDNGPPLVKLIDPLTERSVVLAGDLPSDIATEESGTRQVLSDLPPHLVGRVSYDPVARRLSFGGEMDGSYAMLNIMSIDERNALQLLSEDPESIGWGLSVGELFADSRNPHGIDLTGLPFVRNPYKPFVSYGTPEEFLDRWGVQAGLVQDTNNMEYLYPVSLLGSPKALTAGSAGSTGYVVIAENDHPDMGSAPVALHIFRVAAPPMQGEIRVIEPDNVFGEKLTLRFSGDFGGEPERVTFEWYYQPDNTGIPPDLPPNNGAEPPPAEWIRLAGEGPQVTIEGPGLLTLADNWFIVRYVYDGLYSFYTNDQFRSPWAGAGGGDQAQLAEGWLDRVVNGLNPFDARVTDFHAAPVNTIVSMIGQAGRRYEGPVAFSDNPCHLNSIGIIEAYQTVLDRASEFSIDANISDGAVGSSLMNMATRLSDLYMLLGNEACQDALDPTIGFGTTSGEYGTLASSIFSFQNQVPSLLEEELALLRGRDDSLGSVRNAPVYNRLTWNFTGGDGEIAYVQAYNISDQMTVDTDDDGCADDYDAAINEGDAEFFFPQGHGDAWGHYLTALTFHYDLLRHSNFNWEARAEAVTVGGSTVPIDFQDERKFIHAAASRARTGSEIVDLTYRQQFVEDPAGQWQGYKDTDTDRAWGVDEWARRAAMGCYFDWLAANAMLPDEDPNPTHTGIARVDRQTVSELADVSTRGREIQARMDEADKGLNPLGLAKGVVPFDIDPALVDRTHPNPKTHFEQVYDRAIEAMKNAVTVFDHANQLSRMLRQNQDSVDAYNTAIAEQERDFKYRLLEIFGYPYADDIGGDGAYPAGYTGPDWIHFMYVDPSELNGQEMGSITGYTVTVDFTTNDIDADLGITEATQKMIRFSFTSDGAYMVKPSSWTGAREAPGEIQFALSEFVLAQANLDKAMEEYQVILGDIEDLKALLEAQYDLNATEIEILSGATGTVATLDQEIKNHQGWANGWRRLADITDRATDVAVTAIPDETNLDKWQNAVARAIFKGVGGVVATGLGMAADNQDEARLADELAKDAVDRNTELTIKRRVGDRLELIERYDELEDQLSAATVKRMECAMLKEQVDQALGKYQAAVAKGTRVLDERAAWRSFVAPDIHDYRYQDMAFRVFRNDALQKYRAQFDLAARYVYLAASAYDYETCLLSDDNGSGRDFLADIVRMRSLGQMNDSTPVVGRPGLADVLGRMKQNFDVYKTQLGFNNPQTETSRFSLRRELFRIKTNDTSDVVWRQTLQEHRVADLWDIPEYRKFCRPFAPEDAGAQPGIVIPFSTFVRYGENFFGWPLGGGDSTYDPTHFATRVRTVGLWFDNYDGNGLSLTPRVYLVPTGADVMRSPSDDMLETRTWKVVDQKLPVPFPIGASDLDDPDWIPINDTLSETFGEIRQFSRFRAYHDTGVFNEDETVSDSRLVGRSVWNTEWMLIIPGETLLNPPDEGLDLFINTVEDIKLFFMTYAYSGN